MSPWRETKPAAQDLLNELPSVLTSQAVALRQGLERHSFWTDASGVSAGIPRLSDGSFGPGAARAFFAIASNASSTLSATKPLAGRLFVTSDTHRLYGYSSTATMLLGSENLITYYGPSFTTIPAGTRILAQSSSLSIVINSRTTVVFPSTYSAAPTIQVQAGSTVTTDAFQAVVLVSGTTNVALSATRLLGSLDTCTVWWRAHGTVAL